MAATAELTLKANSRIVRTGGQLFAGFSQVGGYIRVTSTAPIAAFVLYGDSGLDFLAAVPSQSIEP